MHTVEPLLPCCVPEVYEDAPLPPLGSVPVQVEGKGGQLLGRIAENEQYISLKWTAYSKAYLIEACKTDSVLSVWALIVFKYSSLLF
jgi:hypothetical protein